jgi:MtN3 and saliva related transmembrane protein
VIKEIKMIEAIGIIAGTCTTLAFIPQLKKIWISKSAKDISTQMYIFYCSGLLLWTIYGVLINSVSIIIANGLTLLLSLGILFLKIKWRHI